MGRYGASELMGNNNLRKKTNYELIVNYGLNKLSPLIQDSVVKTLDQLSTKVRPDIKYKTDRPVLDGRGIDIHKWIGNLLRPKTGFYPFKV